MGLTVINPIEFKTLSGYDDTVGNFCSYFNNNSTLSATLAQASISSGVIPDSVGTVAGQSVVALTGLTSIDPTNVVIDNWKVFYSNISKILMYDDYVLNLDPSALVGATSNGIRFVYLKSDGTYEIKTSSDTTMDNSSIRLLRYEILNHKLTSVIVYPFLSGTSQFVRTQVLNSKLSTFNCNVSAGKGDTSLNITKCTMLLEGGNIYKQNSIVDPNLVSLPETSRVPVYLTNGSNMFGGSVVREKLAQVPTDKYRDSATNTYKPLPAGKYCMAQVSISPENILVVQLGSVIYNTMTDVLNGILVERYDDINLIPRDIYTPVCRIAFKSGALNGSDESVFKIIQISDKNSIVSGGDTGGVYQQQISDLANRVDLLEGRNNVIVTTNPDVGSLSGLRNNDIVFVVGEEI